MKKRRVVSHVPFSYLEEGKDYKSYELTDQLGRARSGLISLSRKEEERLQGLLDRAVVISLHEHTKVYPRDPSLMMDYIRHGRIWIGYSGLSVSGLDAVFDGLHDGTGKIESSDPWAWENIVYQIGMYMSDLDHQSFVVLAKRVQDIIDAHRKNKIATVLHLESMPNIGPNLDKIDVLYGLGVRCMGTSYSLGNAFSAGIASKTDFGLTDLGFSAIERMNKLGISIDLSHASDTARLQAMEASKSPVFLTHSGARTLWPSRSLASDEALHALAERGGVIGITAEPYSTLTFKNRRHSIQTVMEHFQYVAGLIGIKHVAFGPDTNFGDHVGQYKAFGKDFAKELPRPMESLPPHEEIDFVDGLEYPSKFHNIIRWLVKNGYSDAEIKSVAGENVLRVLRKSWFR